MSLRKTLTGLVAAAVLFAAGVLLFNFVIMPLLIHQRDTVIVPDISGLSRSRAERTLERTGLQMRVGREDYNADAPAGYVIGQNPRANETVKEGRTIEVVLSLGARTQRVPDIRGMSLRQARGALSRVNLRVGSIARLSSNGPPREEVVAFEPDAASEVVEGTPVNLIVRVGGRRARYAMPDLTGQDLLFIREKLRDLGFRVAAVRYERRPGVFPNTVVGQSPAPGAMIREGDSIELVAAGTD